MAPTGKAEQKADKSYLSSAVESLNPWGPRSATPTPADKAEPPSPASTVAPSNDPQDHSVPKLYGQSSRSYPDECPPLQVQWFHAVDVPKRKPQLLNIGKRNDASKDAQVKPAAAPKKFTAFSPSDSKAIEARYQRLLEGTEDSKDSKGQSPGQATVAVNEDFLFDVDIMERELAPVYWLGPIYEVRRGSWFFQEGSTNRPCEENLAAQLEEGYLKMKPWQNKARSRSQSTSRAAGPKEASKPQGTAQPSTDAKKTAKESGSSTPQPPAFQPPSHRLFGMYMNSVVTYQDSNTAWISSEGMLSWVTSSVYEKLGGGAYMGGIKLTRGFAEPSKPKEKDEKTSAPKAEDSTTEADEKEQRRLKRRSAPPSSHTAPEVQDSAAATSRGSVEEGDNPHLRLHRQLSSLMETGSRDVADAEEQINLREEQVIQDDYNAQAGETQGREIEHVILVTHGIGQLLGLRMESVNFVHDVNMMRKTLKSVYAGSEDLKALNSESGSGPGNCRVQVLPVCWRHLLEFPRRREKKKETDVADRDGEEEDEYPSLEDITVEGMAFARSLISDLALDVLLYQSSYREQISKIVMEESNRICRLFKQRNPEFKGKIHLVGHSLGSAIYFDSLCRQRETQQSGVAKDPLRFWPSQEKPPSTRKDKEPTFDFDVADFYCLGSPVGLFQMLKGRTIAGRHSGQGMPSESPLNPENMEDPFLVAAQSTERLSQISGLPFSVSSPKVEQLFNIFHPSDPISYRLEPLISPAMASLKPQQLPYTKKSIFGNVAPQGLTGIGAKVGQSVSDMWSNFSAGIASNLLNRSLGLSNEEVARLAATPATEYPPGAGTNISAGGVLQSSTHMSDKANERKKKLADSSKKGKADGKDAALIDDDIETLFSKFQTRNSDDKTEEERDDEWVEEGRKARKMRTEEAKVRALNRNGRVDYSIQEGTLDFNPMNTIASHLGYWADDDVNHFMLSQLLSNKRPGQKGVTL